MDSRSIDLSVINLGIEHRQERLFDRSQSGVILVGHKSERELLWAKLRSVAIEWLANLLRRFVALLVRLEIVDVKQPEDQRLSLREIRWRPVQSCCIR